jgi:hypothetical protein
MFRAEPEGPAREYGFGRTERPRASLADPVAAVNWWTAISGKTQLENEGTQSQADRAPPASD